MQLFTSFGRSRLYDSQWQLLPKMVLCFSLQCTQLSKQLQMWMDVTSLTLSLKVNHAALDGEMLSLKSETTKQIIKDSSPKVSNPLHKLTRCCLPDLLLSTSPQQTTNPSTITLPLIIPAIKLGLLFQFSQRCHLVVKLRLCWMQTTI